MWIKLGLWLCFLTGWSFCCTLCPLRIPPRPRPLNQYQLPNMPEFNTEQLPQFCNFSKSLPIGTHCRRGFEKLFCSTDKALESLVPSNCPGPENRDQCSKCAKTWQKNKWIVKWFDSLGKPGAGIGDGNYYWLGDYETCSKLSDDGEFDGKYCRVEVSVPDSLVEQGCPQTDPLAINLGVCFPTQCTAQQLTTVTQSISPYNVSISCEFKYGLPAGAYILIVVCVLFLLLQVVATIRNGTTAFWQAICIRRNLHRALSTKREHQGLHALHGLEFLTYFFIILGNVYNYMLPYIENVAFSFDGVHSLPMHLTNNYSYHIDALFALSALFTTYLLHGQMTEKVDIFHVVFQRFIRFWPAYVFTVLFMLKVFASLSAGPMWIHSDTVERCEANWWKNLLFINNYYKVDDTCVDFGYIISLEAQYFLILIVLIYIARSHLVLAVIFATSMLLVSIIIPFTQVVMYNLPPAAILTVEPIGDERMRETLDLLLVSLPSRMGAYCVGFLFGILISNSKRRESGDKREILNSVFELLMFVAVACLGSFVVFSLFPFASRNYSNRWWNGIYAGLHRPFWATAVILFLYLCERGRLSWLNAILTWRVFGPLSKLSWIALILSEPVILYFFTSLNRPAYATHWSLIYSAISTAALSYFFALVIDVFLTRPIRYLVLKTHLRPSRRLTVYQTAEEVELMR